MAKKEMNFEQSITRLDEIVKALESGNAELEKSLTLFEEATGLIKGCSKLLDAAEQKIVKLQKGEDGTPTELPFDTEE